MLRKLLTCTVAVILLVAPLCVFADAPDAVNSVEQLIIDACTYGEEADLSALSLEMDQVEEIFYRLYDSGAFPWYADETYTCHYNADTNQALTFKPSLLDEETYNRALYEQAVARFLDEYIHEGMTPVQMALALHDGLIENCVYDESLAKNTGYDLLVNGTTVCLGYAKAYQDLLSRIGIPSIVVSSEAMEHAWNLVQLDGQWYHVDVTWDDPSPDTYGYVSHAYFLLTDQEIAAGEKPHHDWETDITCTDTRFSNAYWRDISSRICFTSSKETCFVRSEDWDNYIYVRDEMTGEERRIFTDEQDYINIGYGRYCYSHGSLTLCGDRLYYNTMNTLISLLPDGSGVRSEYSYNTAGEGRYLYGCFVRGDDLYISAADHDGNQQVQTAQIDGPELHTHTFTDTVEAPGCTESGYTLSTCDCGLTAKSSPTLATGHDYKQTQNQAATLRSEGWSKEACANCGDTITTSIPKLELTDWISANAPLCAVALLGVIAIIMLPIFCIKGRKKKRAAAEDPNIVS